MGRDVNVMAPLLYNLYLGQYILDYIQGAVTLTQAVSSRPLTAKNQVHSQTSPCEIYDRDNGND